ncbi:MAG TPA: hypothetical protein DEB49_04010, partial [Verrucomicrobiales bacterium]|nr:hypothetical protein [Verrucomicrobiales bacterium]
MRENAPRGKSPKNELAGGGIFGESRLVHVIRKITDARSHLVASVLFVIGGVGVAGAEESVLGHWLFAPDRLEGKVVSAVVGADAVVEGLSRSVTFTDTPAPAHVQLTGNGSRLEVTSDISSVDMPKRDMTLEAWVRVDKA